MQPLRFLAISLLLLTISACNSNQDIIAFAANAEQISALLPRVAAVIYTSCVERATYAQFKDEPRKFPDRPLASKSCGAEAAARDRLAKEFSVLSAYMIVLSKLAAGNHQAAVASAKSIAATVAELSGAPPAVSGLVSAIESALLQGRTRRELRHAITQADPHIQALCAGFANRIALIPALALDTQELELRALYNTGTAASPANRLLLYRQFDAEYTAIAQQRELVSRYASLLQSMVKAHSNLFANRDRLGSKEAMASAALDAGEIAGQLAALHAAVK